MSSISRLIQDSELIGHGREVIAAERSYVMNGAFMSGTTWSARRLDGPKVLYNRSATAPLRISVVGIVSPEDLCMDNHGDFRFANPSADLNDFKDAAYKFTLQCPTTVDTNFAEDFERAIERIEDLADVLPDENRTSAPFVIGNGSKRKLRFSRKMFQHFTTYGQSIVEYVQPSSLERYDIDENFKEFIRQIRFDHLARNLYVWDRNGFSIPSQHRSAFLRNKLVQVYFTLRYVPGKGMLAEFDTISVFSEEYAVWQNFL